MNKPGQSSQYHDVVRQLMDDESITVTVKGECMLPWIENGANVMVSPARVYWPGDVVVFLSSKDQHLAHRVVGLYRRSGRLKVLTQADASQRPDAASSIEHILGRVTGGDCHPHVHSVPLSTRMKSFWRFLRFVLAYVLGKKSSAQAESHLN